MTDHRDPFPTRLESEREMFPRIDPVIHSRNQDRWDGPLGEEALSRYERDGFLWFEGFFSRERVAPFFDELRDLAADRTLTDSDQVILDPGTGAPRSVFAMHRLSQRFDGLTRDPRILGMVRQLLGSDVYIHQSRINDKYGFKGSGFNWHSDFETWHAEDGMPAMRAVSCSILLTDNFATNGPLMLVPGSHRVFVPCVGPTPPDHYKHSLKNQQLGVPDQDSLDPLMRDGGIETFTGRAGSVLLFDCNTLHGSNANMSPFARSNVFFVYNSIHNRLQAPFAAPAPRPTFLAEREHIDPLPRAA